MKKEQRAMHLVAIEEKVVFYLLTYGFNTKRKNIEEKKEVLEVLIVTLCSVLMLNVFILRCQTVV